MRIRNIDAYEVLDSRGNPTVEVEVTLEDSTVGRAIVPSGASTGSHEAWELRDQLPARFGGKSVERAVNNVRTEIAARLSGCDVFAQEVIDRRLVDLDGTPNLSRLGANAILGASMACCLAAANHRRQPLFEYLGHGAGTLLPLPEIQIIGGGAHALDTIDVQDFMIVAVRATSYRQALEVGCDVYRATRDLLRERNQLVGVADEGGFWPLVRSNEAAFELLLHAIERAGYAPGEDVGISLDIAATELYHGGHYHLASAGKSFDTAGFIELVLQWTRNYPIVSIEDPLAEDDWEGWRQLTALIGSKVQLVGDDLFATNRQRIDQGIKLAAANAVLIKLNQVGTVTDTMAAIRQAQENGCLPVISARSGESEDTFIAQLAVATNAGQLKVGSITRGERTAKWNEILRIERALGEDARFVGVKIFESLRCRPC